MVCRKAVLLIVALVGSPAAGQDASVDGPDEFAEWVQRTFDEAPEAPEPEPPEPADGPAYSGSQLRLLQITQAYNSRLAAHPHLMNSAQAVANYHATTGRWAHSSRSSRPAASENIAWNGTRSIDRIGTQWKNSRGHNSNWLGNWRYVGVGVAYTSGRIYAVQHFSNNPQPHRAISLQGRTVNTASRRRGLFPIFRRRR